MTTQDKELVWSSWNAGQSMSDIARDINKMPASVFGFLRQYSGIEPRRRCRRSSHLSMLEHEEISRGIASGLSLRAIARELGRCTSTVHIPEQREHPFWLNVNTDSGST